MFVGKFMIEKFKEDQEEEGGGDPIDPSITLNGIHRLNET